MTARLELNYAAWSGGLTCGEVEKLLDAYRAEVLNEVTDRLARRATLYGSSQTVNEVINDLNRLAAAEAGETA